MVALLETYHMCMYAPSKADLAGMWGGAEFVGPILMPEEHQTTMASRHRAAPQSVQSGACPYCLGYWSLPQESN